MEKNDPEQLELILPLKVGATWQRTMASQRMTVTVIRLESVSVAGKTYENCFHVQQLMPQEKYVEDFWEAPNVGRVKTIVVVADGARITKTVTEFKPGK